MYTLCTFLLVGIHLTVINILSVAFFTSFPEGNRYTQVTIIAPSFMFRTNNMKFDQLNEFFIIILPLFLGGGGYGA